MRRALVPSTKLRPILAARASEMRAAPTTSEALLWEALKGSRLGVAFRRHVPIGRYIADFYAPSKRLVVEVDGGYHERRERADARRDREFARLGVRVLRIEAAVVASRFEEAVRAIVEALG